MGNGSCFEFNNGAKSGWARLQLPRKYTVKKLHFYLCNTNKNYNYFFDFKISEDGGTTYTTLNRYTISNADFPHISNLYITNPYLEIPINKSITEFYLDFPTQEQDLMWANHYALRMDHVILFI